MGTDALQKHLSRDHLKEWIESCNLLGIPLTSEMGKAVLHEYESCFRSGSVPFGAAASQAGDANLPFTKDHFVDALMIWIVADDQGSSLQLEHFRGCAQQVLRKDLSLMLDVEIQWSSTYAMVDHALQLHLAISQFFTSDDFRDLAWNYLLSDGDWDLLKEMKLALEVPHMFRQRLLAEKTPTLCDAIPAFEAMFGKWSQSCLAHPIIDSAIYTLAMAVNPRMKLDFYQLWQKEEYDEAKELFVEAIQKYIGPGDSSPSDEENEEHETMVSWADCILEGSSAVS
ncbi:hypothetical protein GYMLUDRAFT_249010 [Collybiopsis luxurians FD-317 M1]|uniref:Unplaced genomic scaffold GYMLUscaffold_62, whole genome shotgun sequence n=1 Tax=Collybiopsis luxurians FD-317 M1 TaxID=944289 RepID=A0A0D0CAF6_9AGAR|nr:hypothetical protein GYMLUDRAFT_249010 [Collybiopsis luxurians FD-317 M1]